MSEIDYDKWHQVSDMKSSQGFYVQHIGLDEKNKCWTGEIYNKVLRGGPPALPNFQVKGDFLPNVLSGLEHFMKNHE